MKNESEVEAVVGGINNELAGPCFSAAVVIYLALARVQERKKKTPLPSGNGVFFIACRG